MSLLEKYKKNLRKASEIEDKEERDYVISELKKRIMRDLPAVAPPQGLTDIAMRGLEMHPAVSYIPGLFKTGLGEAGIAAAQLAGTANPAAGGNAERLKRVVNAVVPDIPFVGKEGSATQTPATSAEEYMALMGVREGIPRSVAALAAEILMPSKLPTNLAKLGNLLAAKAPKTSKALNSVLNASSRTELPESASKSLFASRFSEYNKPVIKENLSGGNYPLPSEIIREKGLINEYILPSEDEIIKKVKDYQTKIAKEYETTIGSLDELVPSKTSLRDIFEPLIAKEFEALEKSSPLKGSSLAKAKQEIIDKYLAFAKDKFPGEYKTVQETIEERAKSIPRVMKNLVKRAHPTGGTVLETKTTPSWKDPESGEIVWGHEPKALVEIDPKVEVPKVTEDMIDYGFSRSPVFSREDLGKIATEEGKVSSLAGGQKSAIERAITPTPEGVEAKTYFERQADETVANKLRAQARELQLSETGNQRPRLETINKQQSSIMSALEAQELEKNARALRFRGKKFDDLIPLGIDLLREAYNPIVLTAGRALGTKAAKYAAPTLMGAYQWQQGQERMQEKNPWLKLLQELEDEKEK